MDSKVIVVDFDDILVPQSEKLYLTIRKLWSKYSMYFKNLGMLSKKEIYARKEFYFTDWLLLDQFKTLPENQQKDIKSMVHHELVKDFFSKNIYATILPTEFCKKTLLNKVYLENSNIKKVIIVSRNISPEMAEYKKEFAKKYFSNPKIELMFVENDKKKSDILKNLDWDVFIDDELSNIRDVAEVCILKGKEFLIPKFGYNKMEEDLALLIQGKGGTYSYYED